MVSYGSFFNRDSLHARLNSHYKASSYKKYSTKRLKHTGNLFRKNLQLIGVSVDSSHLDYRSKESIL